MSRANCRNHSSSYFLPPGKIFSGRYCFWLHLFFCFFYRPERTFPEGIVLRCVCFFVLFNVCGHSIFRTTWRISTKFSHKVEGWPGSNPIENGRHRFNHLAAILEKLFSHNCDCSCCAGVAFTLAQALTKCHPLHSVHRFQLPYNNLMPAPGDLILASSG